MIESTKLMTFLSLALVLAVALEFSSGEEPFCGNKCNEKGVSTLKNCYCDSACSSVFNDCCGDSEYVFTKYLRVRHRREYMVCQSFANNRNALLVNNCRGDWHGAEAISNSCRSGTDSIQDPMASVPVTNSVTGVTYSNYFCAICNSDVQRILFWNLRITCPSLRPNVLLDKEEAMRHFYFDWSRSQWGFNIRDDVSRTDSFHSCDVNPVVPKIVEPKIRHCDPDEIDMCSPSWKNDVMQQMCHSYSDPVYANNTRYKNFYCAMCNRVDQSDLSCGSGIVVRSGMPERPTANFAVLLDFNLKDGNEVGKVSVPTKCCNGEMYDPLAKKCRNVVCGIPGYVLRGGRCTKDPDYVQSDL